MAKGDSFISDPFAPQPEEAGTRLMDLPSFYSLGNVDNYLSNPYQCCDIEAGGRTERFFAWPPPEAKVTHRLDTQEVKGQDGARLVHTGIQPARFGIKILIWTGFDERRFNAFYPNINNKLRPSGRIVGRVRHPDLDQARISSVYIYETTKVLGADIVGAWTVTIQVMETRFTKANIGAISTTPNQEIIMPNQFRGVPAPMKDQRGGVVPPSAKVGPV